MWKCKKFILILTLAIIALVGGTTGVVMATTTDNGTEIEADIQAETQREDLLYRVGEIYEENTGTALDLEQLQNAFNQAREEMREQAMADRLQEMVDEGIITDTEASELLEWWQAKPDVDLQGIMGFGFEGGMMGGRGHHHGGPGPYCGDI